MNDAEFQLFGRVFAGLVILLPMTICALDIYLRKKFDQDEDRLYRKWYHLSMILTLPAFVLAFAFLALFGRCLIILFSPDTFYSVESLAANGIHKWVLILFVIFLLVQFGVSVYTAIIGWRFGEDHSEYEYSSWFLRSHSRVEVLDKERKIKIAWAMRYYLLPKAVIVYIAALIFLISPVHIYGFVKKITNYAVPEQLVEVKPSEKINGTFASLDEAGNPILHWPRVEPEFFDKWSGYNRQYEITVTYDGHVLKRKYVFSEEGRLISIQDEEKKVNPQIQKEVGKMAEVDKYGYFAFPLTMYDDREYYIAIEPYAIRDKKNQYKFYTKELLKAQQNQNVK